MTTTDNKTHLFNRTEFNQMADMGFFDEKRVELLEGEILDLSPPNNPHMRCVSILMRFLIRNLPDTFEVRCQGSYAASDISQPDLDVYVIPTPPNTGSDIPSSALLVIEIAQTTLARDRRKVPIYAAGGVQEYWIVNLPARQVEQYTNPNSAEARYEKHAVLSAEETLACQTLPLPPRKVAALLPS